MKLNYSKQLPPTKLKISLAHILMNQKNTNIIWHDVSCL